MDSFLTIDFSFRLKIDSFIDLHKTLNKKLHHYFTGGSSVSVSPHFKSNNAPDRGEQLT